MPKTAVTERKHLRLLFVSADKYPPFRPDVAVLFGRCMVSRGHEIDWILQSEQPCRSSHWSHWSGGRVWVARTDTGSSRLARLRKHLYGFCSDLKIYPLLKQGNYDFIQVKDKFLAALVALVVARARRVRFTYWLSYPFPEASLYEARQGMARYPWLYWLRGHIQHFILYKLVLPSADHIFVQSQQMCTDIASYGIPAEKMTPVPMGVAEEFLQENIESDSLATPPSVLYLGTLQKARRLDFMLRVMQRVRPQCPDAVLYFVGGSDNPEDERFLRNECKRLALDNSVVFTGNLPREQALKYVARADVCVSPFFPTPILNSTSPTKLVEYMALGKAVVANDHPEQRRVIEESQGGICVPYDEDCFAQAIVALLKDKGRAFEMGYNARSYVARERKYSVIASKLENEYLRLCAKNK